MHAAYRQRSRGAVVFWSVVLGLVACTSPPTTPSGPTPAAVTPARPEPSAAPAAAATNPAPPPLSPPVSVKVGDGGTVAHRGIYIGLERGYFTDEGLEVELVPFTGDQIPALLTGELYVGNGGATPSLSLVCYSRRKR